jgi:DNA-binding NarL/FixJ family response regulator
MADAQQAPLRSLTVAKQTDLNRVAPGEQRTRRPLSSSLNLSKNGNQMSGVQRPIRVLIINNPAHRLVGDALAVVLRVDPSLEVMDVLEHPLQAVKYMEAREPDVGLVNCLRHEAHATQSTATLRAALPGLRVIVLAATLDHTVMTACIRAGAAGYLTVGCSSSELLTAIKRVYSGEVVFPVDALHASVVQSGLRSELPALTPREQYILQAMADGLTVAETADRMKVATATVQTHVKNAMAKLSAHSRLQAVVVGLKMGIIELRTADSE